MPTKFPYEIDDSTSLLDARDNARTTLISDVTLDSTSIYVASTSLFPSSGVATIYNRKFTEYEKFYYNNTTEHSFDNLTRPTPKSWTVNDAVFVSALITQDYHNYLRDAIIEVEKKVINSNYVIDSTTGILKVYDERRNKWLSASRQCFTFSRSSPNLNSQYLRYSDIVTSINGPQLIRNCTVTSVSIRTQNVVDATFHIRKNNSPTNIHSFFLDSVNSLVIDNLNINLNASDFVQVFMQTGSILVSYPIVILEYSWRF